MSDKTKVQKKIEKDFKRYQEEILKSFVQSDSEDEEETFEQFQTLSSSEKMDRMMLHILKISQRVQRIESHLSQGDEQQVDDKKKKKPSRINKTIKKIEDLAGVDLPGGGNRDDD
jgi:hypothetical protein